MTKYITTVQARKLVWCSTRYLIDCIKTKKLKGKFAALPNTKRKIWLIDSKDFKRLSDVIIHSKRIGREMPQRERKPILSKGYRLIFFPDHPRSYHDGYVPEHILVMEKKLNRPILKTENVHHRNGDRLDNRPENLELFKNLSEHQKTAHGLIRKLSQKIAWKHTQGADCITDEEKIQLFNEIFK